MSLKALPFSVACAAVLSLAPASEASVVINIGSAHLSNNAGVALQAGTLIQLVNLGANGVFDSISVADGDDSGLGRWVSGDDSVLNITFKSIIGVTPIPGDFASTKAFDLEYNPGVVPDSTAGQLSRSFEFEFGDLPAGLKLGIRWFPGLMANDFDGITLASGQAYGQFTRQAPASVVNNGVHWMTPGDGANTTFDPFVTASAGGSEANSVGMATFTVIPEPAAIGMSLLGAAGLAMLRRRRA